MSIVSFPVFVTILLVLWTCLSTATTSNPTILPPNNVVCIQELIDQIGTWQKDSSDIENRTFVTLSFAQSLDGKIAVYLESRDDEETYQTSANYPLSGSESLLLTHALRSIHDGILVGGRTLSTDNPRLTNRLWDLYSGTSTTRGGGSIQPRPIVLDTTLRHVLRCLTAGSLQAKNLIVCCSPEAAALSGEIISKKDKSITVLPCTTKSNGQLDLKRVIVQLRNKFGIHSLMVEGGSATISSFVQEGLVDCLCITIAPKVLGSRGLPAFVFGHDYDTPTDQLPPVEFREIKCVSMGNDCILWARRLTTGNNNVNPAPTS